ncbi:MAG: rhodanese-like domain-containing protein [Synergistetes bacterium]|nr:rhodanese-like domain-containing protein [Synergistota bacterium]MCX8127527.1 rhodanese-like domain-containing protein [Synergistota bacterium]MDW8191556.1 rhodanese-like domain-containing protein [Synergistota bacterium]
MKFVFLTLIIFLIILKMFEGTASALEIPEITPEEAWNYLGKEGYVFLDVREPHEYNEERIKGAINLPKGMVGSKIGELFPKKEAQVFIVYCRSGRRSLDATKTLIEMGYKAFNMKGGILAWKKANLPTEK